MIYVGNGGGGGGGAPSDNFWENNLTHFIPLVSFYVPWKDISANSVLLSRELHIQN